MTEKELRKAYLESSTKRMLPLSFEDWLIDRICNPEGTDPHGHVVSVRLSDLEGYFSEEDLQYVTELMLEDIAETIWNSDAVAWTTLFDEHFEATMKDNAAHWQAMIDEEKKRRQAL